MRPILLCFLLLGVAAPSSAQDTSAVRFYSRVRLQAEVASSPSSAARMASRKLDDRSGYSYSIIRRDQSGEVEVHEDWDDILVIQDGAGTLLHGGTVDGGRQTAPGETRGGVIVAGVAQALSAGDMVVVPAGVPHWFQLAPGQSITYLVVKVAADARAR